MVEGAPKNLLRLEGLALLVAAVVCFHVIGTSWWMFAILFFVPDVSFAAYLLGPKVGAAVYNTMHSTIVPLLLAAIAWWIDFGILGGVLLSIAIVWLGHIGFDRTLGYGLKYSSDFKDTHLGRL